MHYAEYKRSMPPRVTLLTNYVRCVYLWVLYVVLQESPAQLLECVLIVYISPEKVYISPWKGEVYTDTNFHSRA